MSEPLITPASVYTFSGVLTAGHLLGMPIDAVALGAIASAMVTMISEPKNRWLVVAYTVIGGLLGGALAPTLAHAIVGEASSIYPSLIELRTQFANVFSPVLVGLLWQVLLKIARTLWPSFERHADKAIERLLSLRISFRDRE